MTDQISVTFGRNEEFIDAGGHRIWRVVYFVKHGGQTVPVQGMVSLNYSQLSLNFTSKISYIMFFCHFESKP